MTIAADIAGLAPLEIVEMFVFDATAKYPGSTVLRWHPGTTVEKHSIVWQGVTYTPYPAEVTGIDEQTQGKLPRPTLRASNIGGQLGGYLRTLADGLGAKVTRKRTLGRYLDAVNFPNGNPNANPDAGFDDDVFYVARRVAANPIFVEYELAVGFDVTGIVLPRRQVMASTCMWVYRSAECSYAGGAILNDPTYPGVDQCGKTLTSCKLRFGKNGVLPTSAFPASLLASYV